MREIRFRMWINGHFDYWGFMEDGFSGPATSSGDPMTSEERRDRCQMFTGLLDKNGKEIYEGDVVNITMKWGGKVDEPEICTIEDIRYLPMIDKDYYPDVVHEVEVIGDIYSTPELLEETK